MPKKPNRTSLQNYVPAGNGDASGEYADEETGSNIHFTSFKKPEEEQKDKIDDFEQSILLDLAEEELTKIHNEKKQEKQANFDNDLAADLLEDDSLFNIDEGLNEINENEISEPSSVELDNLDLDDNETKAGILNLNPELDKDKVMALDEKGAKKLLKAIDTVDNYNKKVEKLGHGQYAIDGIWKESMTPAQLYDKYGKDGLLKSIELKEQYFNSTNDQNNLEKLSLAKEDINKYISKREKLDKQYQKAKDLINSFDNPNNIYSQKRKDSAVWCKSTSESSKIFPHIENVKGITSAEQDALVGYTGSYSFINEPLRGTKYGNYNTKKTKFISAVKNMTSAIDKSVIDFDFWTQRGTSAVNFPHMKIDAYTDIDKLNSLVGTTFEDQAFVSTGAAKNTGFSSHNIILNIYCPKGTKGAYVNEISAFKGENELILQRGYSYKVTKVEKKNGKIYMDCDLLLGSDKNKYNDEQLEQIKQKYFI